MSAKEEIQQRIRAMLKDGTAGNPTHALDQIAAARPDLWEAYMKEPPSVHKAAPAPVEKAAVQKHWSVVELEKRVEVLKQQQPALTHTAAWGQVLKTAEGSALYAAHYASNRHLRRQG